MAMKKSIALVAFILGFVFTAHAYATIPESGKMIGEGLVQLPTSLLKIVGGSLKMIGEVLLLPFTLF